MFYSEYRQLGNNHLLYDEMFIALISVIIGPKDVPKIAHSDIET